MQITIQTNEEVIRKNLEEDASAFYSALGEILSELPIPNEVTVTCDHGTAKYAIVPRSGTRFITQTSNNIHIPQKKPFPVRYLIMVNANHNNYKCATRS